MPTHFDIYRSAAVLIEHHGDGAEAEAERRAHAMLVKGNLDGQRVWLAIAAAVRALGRIAPRSNDVTH